MHKTIKSHKETGEGLMDPPSLYSRDLLSKDRRVLLTNEVLSGVMGFGITGH